MSEPAYPNRTETLYRQLLAVYPAEHRARYGEEMIGVLMAARAPGQRGPDIRELLNLVVSGLRCRLRAGVGGGLSPASRSAAAVFGLATSIVLTALSWYEVAAGIAWRGLFGTEAGPGWPVPVPDRALAMGVGWTLVTCACVAGLRRIAALGAVLGLLGEAIAVSHRYQSAPDSFVSSWWLLILTTFAVGCLVALTGSVRAASRVGWWRGLVRRDPDGVRPLSRRAVVALAAGCCCWPLRWRPLHC